MKKSWLTFLFALLVHMGWSQIELGECDQPYNDKVEKQVSKALTSLNKKDYNMARIYVNNALEMDLRNAHALYLMGELAIKRDKNIRKAEAYWTQLMDVCPNYMAEVQFFLGVIYLENGKKHQAEEILELFLKNPERDRAFDKEAKSILEEIRLQEDLFANPVPFDPRPVMNICTRDDEYLAIISPDQELCFFTRRSKKMDKYSGPAGTKRIVEEFCMAHVTESGKFEKGIPLESPFNENFNEGGPSVTANNNELYFTVCQVDKNGYENCDIYYCVKDYGLWGDIKNLGEHINTPNFWESQPSVSADGRYLYFVSNREGGVGGLDLYVCERELNGKWGAPQNLGKTINTPKNEKSPFIHSDSETLYFASDGHPTLGGYDIYYSKADIKKMEFEKPNNIGYPINTKADEIALFVSLNGKKAYFSSNKLKGPGGWDFYSFDLHEAARPEKVALVKGTLLDDDQEVVQDAELQIKNLKTKEIQRIDVDAYTGKYAAVVKIREQEDLILKVEKKGTAFTSKLVDIEDEESTGVVEAEFEVSPITVGKEYRLNDINFATDSYELTEKATYVIDEFILFLQDNPQVKADIQGHTDNAGSPEDNLVLSKNRAKVVYDYLVAHGINAARLKWHGYGETRPVASNNTKKGMAKNRRTVFVITSK